MARNRMIKPEFWSSEDIIELEYTERLFYIGFWNFADDSGVLPDKPKSLKCNIFPADNVDCKPIIETLVTCGLLVRYMVGTDAYLRVAQWDKHQTIKHPTFKYPLESNVIPVHVRYKGSTCTEGVLLKEKEKEKEKEEVKEKSKPKRFTQPLVDTIRAYCRERKNNVDPVKFFNFYTSKGWMVGSNKMKDWKAAVRTWEGNSKDSQKPRDSNDIMGLM